MNRLQSKKAIRIILAKGKWLKDDHFTVKYLPQIPENTQVEVAITVSKKVSKHANERNRLKRRISAIVEERLKSPYTPHQIILIPRASALACTQSVIERSITELLNQLDPNRYAE